ncbi:MAG: hypothetical protein AB9891_21535 [Anaerolineaceae bacterium]
MNDQKPAATVKVTPPGLISSITSGFNSIAGNIQLILFPLLFDLFLWFGPHVRLRTLAQPFIDEIMASMADLNQADMGNLVEASREMFIYVFDHFNLVTSLHTFPVGIPSLLLSSLPIATPLGNPPVFEPSSITSVFLMWIGFSLIGLITGSWFFYAISSKTAADSERPNVGNIGEAALQTLLLTIFLFIFITVLLVPTSMILYIFTLISPLLSRISIMVMGLVFIWMFIPFVFSPHGIFTHQLSALKSILVSLRLVRRFLPGTGLFILMLLLLSEGLNMLWRFPPETSWMTLVGILGHSFISTALVSSMFFYYRSGIQWMEEVINRTVGNSIKA